MASPSPVLPTARERELSARAKRSNTLGTSSAGIPGPLSTTSIKDRAWAGAGTIQRGQRNPYVRAGWGVNPRVGEQISDHLV